MRKLIIGLALAASALGSPARAQQTYPTAAAGVRVQGTVPLQCDGNGANCAPAGAAVADNATDAGTTQKVGGIALSGATFSSYASGARAPLNLGPRGALRTEIMVNGNAAVPTWTGVAFTDALAWGAGTYMMGTAGPSFAFNGTSYDRMRGDTNAIAVQPALSANFWNYAAPASGIVNTTTAVTIKAAAGAGVRNYLCTLNVGHDTLGAASEFAVRDGAAGTVLFRMKLQTAANEGNSEVTFNPCLKGTANTLMEVVTLTATVSGGTYVNASGYTGS